MTATTNSNIVQPRIVKKASREKTAKALIAISELGRTKNPGEHFDATEIAKCIANENASKLLFTAIVENNLIEKVGYRKYLIHLKRSVINVDMAIKLIQHYNKKASDYGIERANKKAGLKQKTDKFILIPKTEYSKYQVCESVQDIQKCIPASAGEYIILNVISGVKVELKTQIIDMS